tara:strand:+ start:884 stop:1138 length:255 start_codon:yes stop_codon:yes gene_type:complete
MSEYRLHVDIPLGTDEKTAAFKANLLIQEFLGTHEMNIKHLDEKYNVRQFNYRLGHDEDRQKSNYLDVNENGHASNKKTRIQPS